MIYLVTFVLALALLVPGSIHRSLNLLAGLLLLTVLCVMGSIRQDTGTDFPTYVAIWNASPTLEGTGLDYFLSGFYEPLFALATAGLKTLSSSQLLFFAFYACLTLVLLHIALRRLGPINLPYAYLMYFAMFYLPYTFNGMRQAVAMSFFILAIPAILKRRTGSVLAWTLFAAGFHFSGLLIGIGYLFLRMSEAMRLTPWKVFLIAIALGCSLIASGALGRVFFLIFPGLAEVYSELFDATTSVSNMVMRIGVGALMLLYADQGKGDRGAIDKLIIMYCLGLVIYLALFQFNVLATRFNMMFRLLEIVLFPMIAFRLTPGKRLVFVTITLLLAGASLWTVMQSPDYDYQVAL